MRNRRTSGEIEDDWDDQIDQSLQKSKNDHDKELAALLLLLLFSATYDVYQDLSDDDLEKLGGSKDIDDAVKTTLKENGIKSSDINKAMNLCLPDESKSLDLTLNNIDIIGQFGYHEATIQGEIQQYILFGNLGIPWRTCEDNENCQTSTPPCSDCEDYSGVMFSVNEFPEPLHDLCRCNEPIADPVPMFISYNTS